jgi:hypothetical protein
VVVLLGSLLTPLLLSPTSAMLTRVMSIRNGLSWGSQVM